MAGEEKKKKEKLSFAATMSNSWFAMKLAAGICPGIIVHSVLLWIVGHSEWVFFDGVFMKVIVNISKIKGRKILNLKNWICNLNNIFNFLKYIFIIFYFYL